LKNQIFSFFFFLGISFKESSSSPEKSEFKTLDDALEGCTDYEKFVNTFSAALRKRFSCEAFPNLVKIRDVFEQEIKIQVDKLHKNQPPYSSFTIEQKNNLITLFGMELDKQYGYGHFVVVHPPKKELRKILSHEAFKERYNSRLYPKAPEGSDQKGT